MISASLRLFGARPSTSTLWELRSAGLFHDTKVENRGQELRDDYRAHLVEENNAFPSRDTGTKNKGTPLRNLFFQLSH